MPATTRPHKTRPVFIASFTLLALLMCLSILTADASSGPPATAPLGGLIPTSTSTDTAVETPSATYTPTSSRTPMLTSTVTRTRVPTQTHTATDTPIPTHTPTPTFTPSATPVTLPYCWQLVPGPDAGQNWTHGRILAISALSPSNIWTLTTYTDSNGIGHTSAARWNGSTWNLFPVTLPQGGSLSDLIAISNNDVWAIGTTSIAYDTANTLTMHWNGSQWSVVPSPNGQYSINNLVAVDASTSTNIWAVGSSNAYDPGPALGYGYGEALVLRWNGTQWDSVGPHETYYVAYYEAVETLSPSSVWVGGMGGPALLFWNGTTWVNATPNGVSWVRAISELSPTDVWVAAAEGYFMHSNGSQWTPVSSQGLNVTDIKPVTSQDIWASSTDRLLHWNGTLWGIAPLIQGQIVLDMAALSSTDVWSVGYYFVGSDTRMLALHYNPSCIPTPRPTSTRTATPGPTNTPTATSTPDIPPCPGERFTDVCPPDYFYPYVQALADDGILSGYSTSPPCPNSLWIPCFRPYNSSTRGQIAKVVSLAAGFTEPVTGQRFEDVPPGSTFYDYVQRMADRGIISGYPCGGPFTPCIPPYNRPYFRTNNNVTRGQLSKMIANAFNWTDPTTGQIFEDVPPGSTFYDYVGRLYSRNVINGYPCGTPSRPCVPPNNLPYFHPNIDVTRGQTAKIVQLARSEPTPTPTSTPTNPDCQGIPESSYMQITPSNCGPAGATFTFVGTNFQPHEFAHMYLVAPDGSIISSPSSLTEVDGNGVTSPWPIETFPDFPLGDWHMLLDGVISGHQAIGYFRVLSP